MSNYQSIVHQIHQWYKGNKRCLPWRDTCDPYRIWLSEIILQQTRIDQGIHYYARFVDQFPTVVHLANASEDEVLKLWQGLGYYSRARNLHLAARQIVELHDAVFPSDYKKLLALKGVGKYTASAIASIAFGLPYAAVDGNVYRVLSRVLGIFDPIDSPVGKRLYQVLAEDWLTADSPGDHNQAMMEFGALQCRPRRPDCGSCPVAGNCIAYRSGNVDILPIKQGRVTVKERFFNYLVFENEDSIWLNKREKKDIWQNLYEFPLIETTNKTTTTALLEALASSHFKENPDFVLCAASQWKNQLLSHQRIHYRYLHFKQVNGTGFPENYVQINKKDISNFAVPKPVEKGLQKFGFI